MAAQVEPLLTGTASAAQLARLLDLSPRRLRELAEQGVIPRVGGRYPLPAAVTAYVHRLREQAAGRLGEGGEGLDLTAERAALARAQRLHTEMRMAKERGELVDATTIRLAFTGMVTAAKSRLLAVPSKAKSRVPTLSVRDVDALDALVREALVELADDAEVTA